MKHICNVVLALLILSNRQGNAESHGFTVLDSIQMNRFSDPPAWYPQAEVKFSPDRKHFLIVTSRGRIESNQTESSLWVFDSGDVRSLLKETDSRRVLKPRLLARLIRVSLVYKSVPYAAVLSDARWSYDSKTIFFLGQTVTGNRQLYRVSLVGGSPQPLTPKDRDVLQFDFSGNTLIYTAIAKSPGSTTSEVAGDPINQDARVLTGLSLTAILFPQEIDGITHAPELWKLSNGRTQLIRDSAWKRQERVWNDGGILSLSRDSRAAIRLLPVLSVPDEWKLYEPAHGFESRRILSGDPTLIAASNFFRLRQYALVDLKSGNSVPLLDAPGASSLAYSDQNSAVWSRDGRRILLTNTFLPLAISDLEEKARRTRSCAAAVLDTATHKTQCLAFSHSDAISDQTSSPIPLRLESASFETNTGEVVLQFSRAGSQIIERFRYQKGVWETDHSPHKGTPLSIDIEQGLNQPPTLWATDSNSALHKKIWDPNPKFAMMRLSVASVYRWRDKSGYTWSGGLFKPIDYVAGRRYPLVIQTHGFNPDMFLSDGSFPTAMAARPLATSGLMVLQMDERRDHAMSAMEAPDQESGIEAAIAQLTTDGLIDPRCVGIIGFSRTSWHVEAVLERFPSMFAAAVIADGVDMSYMQYLMFSEENPALKAEFERINGEEPFGPHGIERWARNASGFSLYKLQTPLRIESHGGSSILQEWELYASLRLQHKPVELIDIPSGQHILQKPLELFASQQGTVDWFRFWLQGYERPNPEDPDQYKRWEHLRELQDAEDKAAGITNLPNPQ